MTNRRTIVVFTVAALTCLSGVAAAQDRLDAARTLYGDASYEEALAVLDRMTASAEVQQYRALCFLALGRPADAERAITIAVTADPFFRPNADDVSPRMVSMFAAARGKLLPQLTRSAFSDATTLYREGSHERAAARFDEVLRLLSDPALVEDAGLSDLKVVATGFADLVRAQLPRPAAADPIGSTAAPARQEEPAAEAPKVSVSTPPVAIRQVLPPWNPPDIATGRRAYSGSIKVAIDKEGKVIAATRERTVHPAYDHVVLEAARGWLYRPATLNGVPVNSETTVEINLKPSGN